MEEKFSKIYDDYYLAIRCYINKKLNDIEVSSDITHDVFLKAFTAMKKGHYKEGGYLRAYLYTLAYNETSNYLGSMHFMKSVTTYRLSSHSFNQIIYHHDIIGELYNKEKINQVVEIVRELPSYYQETFFMVYFDGFKYKEVAKNLTIPIGTVKFRINHCKGILKEKGFVFYKDKMEEK